MRSKVERFFFPPLRDRYHAGPALLAVLLLAGSALGFDAFITIRDGYFYDPATGRPWVPHGVAYQTWNQPLGVMQTYDQIEYDLDEMVKMGANSLRIDMVWKQIEEAGDNQFDWEKYDFFLQACEERGLRVFALIGYQWPPDWFPDEWYTMHPPGYDNEGIYHPERWQSDIINYEHPEARAQYAEWMRAVCSRYKDNKAIVGWIVGNEYGYLGLWSLKYDGYDPWCEQAFRNWCSNRYHSIEALNEAWGTSYTSFDQIKLVEEYAWKGTNGAEWADMVQWHEDSIASFTAMGAAAAREADTNHLLSYATVGMQWGEEDWRYHAEDRGKIARYCAASNAPLDFFSINNYPWALDGHETRNGHWGVSYTKKIAQVPVLYTETGFTSSEILFPGMDEQRQGILIRNSLWEGLEAGAIGTHIFTWQDRPWITDREKGFGIVYGNRVIKPAYWDCRAAYNTMDQVDIHTLLSGSQDPKPDIAFLWDDATDSQYCRFENEMQQEAGALERLGYEPNFIMGLQELADGAYTNFRVIILPRNMRVGEEVPGTGKSVLEFLRTEVIPAGVHVLAVADLPGMQDRWGKPRPEFEEEVRELFGIDAVNKRAVQPPGTMQDSVMRGYFHPIDVEFLSAAPTSLAGFAYGPKVWKYNEGVRVTDGELWAVMDPHHNRGFEDAPDWIPGWNWWGNVAVRQWGWQYDGSNMVQLWGWSGLWQDFDNVLPGHTYVADAWLRNNSDDPISGGTYGVIAIEWYDEETNMIGSPVESARLTGPNDCWQYFAVTSTAPAEASFGRVVISLKCDGCDYPTGSLYVDNEQRVPAVVAKDHGSAKAVIVLYSLECGTDVDGDNEPDLDPWEWRWRVLRGIIHDYFGVEPAVEVLGTNAYLCLPEYRTCADGSTLWQIKSYMYDWHVPGGGDPMTFTIRSDLLKGKTVRAFLAGRILTTNCDGTLSLTLDPDGMEMLHVYDPVPGDLVVQISDAPSVVHPFGDKTYAIKVKFDTLGRTGLVLKVAFKEVGDNGDGQSNEYYQVLSAAVTNAGEQTFWMWFPDFSLEDDDYISTPDGGRYEFVAWLEDGESNVLAQTIGQATELDWGIRPTNGLPQTLQKGQTVQLPVEWENLYEYLSWQGTPMTRNDAFPGRVALFRSRKTEDLFPGQFARANAVADWLESIGYSPGNPLDLAFDNVLVTDLDTQAATVCVFSDDVESGTNGWEATGLWHVDSQRSFSPSHAWTYNDGTDYDTGAANSGSLLSPWISLQTGMSARLSFRSWYHTEDTGPTWDRKVVYVTTDGTNWIRLRQVAGKDQQWVRITCDLGAFVGRQIRLRFEFDTVDAVYNRFPGWFIDDIQVTQAPLVTESVFSDDVESGTNGWEASGLWHVTEQQSSSPTHSWGYNDGTDYDTGGPNSGSLISPWIDLSGAQGARLTFRSWYQTEDDGTAWDRKLVYVTTDGTNWQQVLQVSGPQVEWTTQSVDLGAYVGKSIRIRFCFDTVDGLYNNYAGWFVDDVEVSRVVGQVLAGLDENVESGTNGWEASGLWHVTEQQSSSPTHSWGYNDGTDYDTGGPNSGSLISPWIDLSGAEGATLSFRSWYETEDTGIAWDRKLVYVTTDGSNWEQVLQVSGTKGEWTTQTADLGAYVGNSIRIRFYFDTVDGLYNNYAGWFVDDIRVTMAGSGVLFADDFSDGDFSGWERAAGCANWTATGGVLRAWRIGNSDNILVAGDETWSNYAVSADIRYNRQGYYFNDAELYVRYQDRDNFVKVGIRNFYGFWRLKYTVRYQTNIAAQGWLYNFSKTNHPVEDVWYNLKVVVSGDNYRVYFDGAEVGSFTVTNFAAGRIGVGTMAQQLGIREPQRGYFFIDDDEYSFWAPEGQAPTNGRPLNLDWHYLHGFYSTLILPGTYVMSDTEVSNVIIWLTNGFRGVLATDGGVACKDETGADDPGRIESIFRVEPYLMTLEGLQTLEISEADHYVTLDYPPGDTIPVSGSCRAWTALSDGTALGRLHDGTTVVPAMVANVITNDPNVPRKALCFNFSVDSGGQLTNQMARLAQRAFEWLRGQAHKVRLELKYESPTGDPTQDILVFADDFWVLNGWGSTSLVWQVPDDGIMTGDRFYWVMYTYPWDAADAWTTHDGFYCSANDGSTGVYSAIEGKGLQILGITPQAFAGRAWDMWAAYNTRGEAVEVSYGVMDSGELEDEDNFNDGDYDGWQVSPDPNIQWSVTPSGALCATVIGTGGYSHISRQALDLSDCNVSLEYDVLFEDGAHCGGLVYRGCVLYVNPDLAGWEDGHPSFYTNIAAVLTTGQWHHVVLQVHEGSPYWFSDLYVDGEVIFLQEPIEVTNWTSASAGFLSPYYQGRVQWDNWRVADQQYTEVSEIINGERVPTNDQDVTFWPFVPDYDPGLWEHAGSLDGAQYRWYVYMRGEGVHAYSNVEVFFAPRLMVEESGFPTRIDPGRTASVPLEWEHLNLCPVYLDLRLEDPYVGTCYVSRTWLISSTSGCANFSVDIPPDLLIHSNYVWVAYMYPTNASDPMAERLGLDDTFRFDPQGAAVGPETVIAARGLRVYGDVGIPSGCDVYTWRGASATFDGSYQDSTAPEGGLSFRTWCNSWAGWGVFQPGGRDMRAYSNGYLRFWVKSTTTLKIEIEDTSGNKGTHYVSSTGGVWEDKAIPVSLFSGVNLSAVYGLFEATCTQGTTFYIDYVRWTR